MSVEQEQLQALQDILQLLTEALPHLFSLIVTATLIICCVVGFQTGNKR